MTRYVTGLRTIIFINPRSCLVSILFAINSVSYQTFICPSFMPPGVQCGHCYYSGGLHSLMSYNMYTMWDPNIIHKRTIQWWHLLAPYGIRRLEQSIISIQTREPFSIYGAIYVSRIRVIDGRTNSPKLSVIGHQHFPLAWSSPCGQCWKGSCRYPISSKKWIWSLCANREAPMLCTGASPHRWCWKTRLAPCVENIRSSWTSIPHNRIRLSSLRTRRTSCKVRCAKSWGRRSQSCSSLPKEDMESGV